LFFVLSVCLVAFQIGCWQKNDKNPVAALPDSTLTSSVAFKIVTPSNKTASFSASIRAVAENQAFVTFQLKLANFGNSLTPFSLVKKQAPVVNGSATVIFESLPNTTVVGSLQIENGNIDGFSNFHGAADLNQGSNIVELAPVGSLMPQDVLANAVSEIVSSTTLFLKAPTFLATELAKIVSNLPLDSTSVYDEVLNNFSNKTGIPLVELLAPANAQTFPIGSNVNIIASATDLDGNISRIEFYQNSIKIGEKSSLPLSLEWQPSATGTYAIYAKAIDNNAAVGVSAYIAVIVVDSPPTYTVTYNGNSNAGGSVPMDDKFYQSGATVTVKDNIGNLTKTGYAFAGWNTAADGSGTSYNPTATFSIGHENITLYAKWQSSAYSWAPGNAALSETNFAVGRPTAISSDSSFSSPSAVDGNTMSRWESNRNDPGPDETTPHFLIVDLQQNREVQSIKVNISGWDSWKQNFSIFTSTDLQNWSLVASEQDKTGIFSYNIQPTSVRYVKFSSTYSADNGQVNLYELEVYGAEQVTNTYSVSYNGNGNTGGSAPTDNQNYQQGSTATVKGNTGSLVKTGYTFSGWNTAADGSGQTYLPGSTVELISNIELFAIWYLAIDISTDKPISFVAIDPGEFLMGYDGEESSDLQKPVHGVSISKGFLLSAFEITQAQFLAIMSYNPSFYNSANSYSNTENHPVEQVTWYDAINFCNSLSLKQGLTPCYSNQANSFSIQQGDTVIWSQTSDGFRLPTEAEWEYACRAGSKSRFYWGDSKDPYILKQYAWYVGNSYSSWWSLPHADYEGTQPVGLKMPNSWGLYDMQGNVCEWCWDFFSETYYSSAPMADPLGPTTGSDRSFKGGSWHTHDVGLASGFRYGKPTSFISDFIGFRIVKQIP